MDATVIQEKPSLSQIERSVSEAYAWKESSRLSISHNQLGSYTVQLEQYRDFSIRQACIQPGEAPIQFSSIFDEPTLIMYFQWEGKTRLSTRSWNSHFQTRQQLISWVPYCHSFLEIPRQTKAEDMGLRIKPHLFEELLMENNGRVSDFIYQRVAREESLPKVKGNFFMDATTYEILQSIRACPYQGKMREMYLEAQTKLLLLHQFSLLTEVVLDTDLSGENKLNKADIERLQELRLYLEAHFLEEHSLQSLARRFGLNLFKLKYGFKKLFDTSVMRWLDEKKLEFAHSLLQQEEATIFEVAEKLNYQHHNNFSAAFKRKYGYSPQTLRKSAFADGYSLSNN